MRQTSQRPCPWTELDENGSGLTVLDFITVKLSALTSSLRRDLTTPYADEYDLSVSEWRLLSLIAHANSLPFGELVVQSTSDKALVSRTVRLLEKRNLVYVSYESGQSRKRLFCHITPQGQALYDQIFPIARRKHAEVLRSLTPTERENFFSAIQKLQHYCDTQLIGHGKKEPRKAGRPQRPDVESE